MHELIMSSDMQQRVRWKQMANGGNKWLRSDHTTPADQPEAEMQYRRQDFLPNKKTL